MSLTLGCLSLFVIQPLAAGFVGVKYYAIYSHFPCLFLGSFFAFLYSEDTGRKVNKKYATLITISLAMIIWYYPNALERTFYCRILPYLSSVILVAFSAFVKDSFNLPLLGRIFQYLGSRSYSFYAVQLVIANYVVFYMNSIYFPKDSFSEYEFFVYQLIIFFVVLLVVTEVLFRIVEKPFRRISQK
jgi:peptidoglycan/LPS O-acetylase OafA/YrhL